MGEVFAGRYELIDMIGEGGMGAVWRVRDLKRERIIAAKVLRQSDAGSLLRFMREQGMRIHHPHVVTPLGWAGEDDQVLFTMPIVEGGSVSTLAHQYGSLPTRFAAELLRQLLIALDAVHSAGIVHRDIKPANLLLDATGTDRPHLWLTDFGVALAVDAPRLTSMSVVMGTPGYLAPEQLRGADPDPVADLYAVGMVGFQLVTGHRPAPQLRSERLDLPSWPAHTPEPLWDLFVRLADPDPDGRPRSAREALRALEHPDLAWQEQREIDVARQMPELPGVSEGEFLRPDEAGRSPGSTGMGQFPGSSTSPLAARGTLRQPVAPAAGPGDEQARGAAHGGAASTPGAAHGRGVGTPGAHVGGAPGHGAPRDGAPPAYLPAAQSAAGSRRAAGAPARKGPLAVLIAAPVAALLVVGALLLQPWQSGDPPAGVGGAPVVHRGGVCGWWDAGSRHQDPDGTWLRCTESGGAYSWQTSR